jgi:hypothetical protein
MDASNNMFTRTCAVINSLFKLTKIYILWIVLHFISSHLYVKLCVQNTITGFLISPFMAVTPQCQALRWVIYNGGNSINAMWIIIGSWALLHLIPIRAPIE